MPLVPPVTRIVLPVIFMCCLSIEEGHGNHVDPSWRARGQDSRQRGACAPVEASCRGKHPLTGGVMA